MGMNTKLKLKISSEEIELLIQEIDGIKWPCICGKARVQERDLLCGDCWDQIPQAKRTGFKQLEADVKNTAVECHMAAEQILRLAQRNLGQNARHLATAVTDPQNKQ